MTDKDEALSLEQTLRLALEYVELVPDDRYSAEHIDQDALITAIKAALEAKVEPVVWNEGVPAMLPKQKEGETFIVSYEPKLEAKDEPWSPVSIGVDVTKEGTHVIAMRLRPNGVNEVIYSQFHPLSRQEAKDEPVAWQYRDANDDGTWSAWTGCDKRLTESDWRKVRPLYTPPPPVAEPHKRPSRSDITWVGLNETECGFLFKVGMTPFDYYQAIEAKLKEKNGYA